MRMGSRFILLFLKKGKGNPRERKHRLDLEREAKPTEGFPWQG
jgi:hypothetical protein